MRRFFLSILLALTAGHSLWAGATPEQEAQALLTNLHQLLSVRDSATAAYNASQVAHNRTDAEATPNEVLDQSILAAENLGKQLQDLKVQTSGLQKPWLLLSESQRKLLSTLRYASNHQLVQSYFAYDGVDDGAEAAGQLLKEWVLHQAPPLYDQLPPHLRYSKPKDIKFRLGIDLASAPDAVTVLTVYAGYPADGRLRYQDLLVGYQKDDAPVYFHSRGDFWGWLQQVKNTQQTLVINRDGQSLAVEINLQSI